MLYSFYALGRTIEVSLSGEGIETHCKDEDEDVSPPPSKTICVTTTSETNEAQEQVTACGLEIKYIYRFIIF